MAAVQKVPDIVVGRLPVYLRALQVMAAEGREITSSQELGERLGISSAQIRKDLSYFGTFGKQGTGYRIPDLIEHLRRILKVDRTWDMILIGAGNLGHALAQYQGFTPRGFRLVAIFDNDPEKIGRPIGPHVIQDVQELPEFVRAHRVQIAMIAVPASAAQQVADLCVEAGIRAILNYAPIHLKVPKRILVQYIDPAIHLQQMTYYLGNEG
ncbi:redox-sensing transcriptional repressor Rex [Thermoflexus hugenholtzii]|mgnify:CR=1 FL=1|jgi:AT-rich DNA-binding protein|uniref:Redox-sensing transcriptional repressor Rex n=1 Tax=Thermoflexus hugenholtzii JAD2 TaxID=877466 RepID=A0A212PZR4_9CHLR|nr:redox-sensing transcriptional repressor Rex [Thermoflexus hugenholtzii]SNB52438.1 redox-sensing transcriptional repressor [Thermoflexus hugenholtzii JAD2]